MQECEWDVAQIHLITNLPAGGKLSSKEAPARLLRPWSQANVSGTTAAEQHQSVVACYETAHVTCRLPVPINQQHLIMQPLVRLFVCAASKPFDAMNGIAASMLLNMTSSMRFDGSLNVDLNDITMNLVPYPQVGNNRQMGFSGVKAYRPKCAR
jgi:hypothetical protein